MVPGEKFPGEAFGEPSKIGPESVNASIGF